MVGRDREFVVISGPTIHRLLHEDIAGCAQVVRDAYLAHDAGQTVNPQSVFLRIPDRPSARIIGLPAHLRGPRGVSGIKWIASYPENVKHRMPRANAVLILNESQSGYPFACLESSVISAARTAASAVLAAEHIRGGRRTVAALGVVGTGHISRYVVNFLVQLGWEIETICAHDIDANSRADFIAWLRKLSPDTRVLPASGAAAVLASCDLVVFATIAVAPHVTDVAWLERCPTVLHLSLRDLAPQIILRANNVVDDPEHVIAAGTSVALAAEASGGRSFITCTLADLLLGRKELPRGKPTVFSPFGLGILDLAVGEWIYRRAVELGAVSAIKDFFVA